MPLKDRFRRAVGRSNRSSSNSSVSTSNPTAQSSAAPSLTNLTQTATATVPANAPAITLTKTSSRLSKTLTWGSKTDKAAKGEAKRRKRIEKWEKEDGEAWVEPKTKYPGRKSKQHQDLLRSFEWKFGRKSIDGRSMMSGVSPGASRVNSVDGGNGLMRIISGGRKRSSVGAGSLSREVSRDQPGSMAVGTVVEE
jgi:hypothetical protein